MTEYRILNSELLQHLINEDKYYAAMSYFQGYKIRPCDLFSISNIITLCKQHFIVIGLNLEAEFFSSITFDLCVDYNSNCECWLSFIDWVAKSYGSCNIGTIIFPGKVSITSATKYLSEALGNFKTQKELLGLLAISQISKADHPELDDQIAILLKREQLGFFALRIIAMWASLMRSGDKNLRTALVEKIIHTSVKKTDYINAAYSLECLHADSMQRLRLAQSAISSPTSNDFGSQTADIFHLYILRYLSLETLDQLKASISEQKILSNNSFLDSLLLCIDTWIHIRKSPESSPTLNTLSDFLSDLCLQIYPSLDSANQSLQSRQLLPASQLALTRDLSTKINPSTSHALDNLLPLLIQQSTGLVWI